MDRRIDLFDLRAKLDADDRPTFVRALIFRDETGWKLFHAAVLIGAEPPDWVEESWVYEQHAFVACQLRAGELSSLCSTADETMTLGTLLVSVPASSGPAQMERLSSFSRYDEPPLPIPVSHITIAPADRSSNNVPHAVLIADDAPSFPEPNCAWRAFTTGDYSLVGAGSPPNDLAVIRFAETDAWIGPVRSTPTQLTVNVEGDAVSGATLELFGATGRTAHRLDGPGPVTFPLLDGLPSAAWLWLKRGKSWLDQRALDRRLGWTGDLARAKVEIEMPADPQANVEAMIFAGEGPELELKSRLPDTGKDRTMLKTVAAFANGDGGVIVFGVDRDEINVVGLDGEPTAIRERLESLVFAAIEPHPKIEARPHRVNGKLIFTLKVEAGPDTPYAMIPSSGDRQKPEYYIRRGANTVRADPNELRQAVLSRGRTEPPTTRQRLPRQPS